MAAKRGRTWGARRSFGGSTRASPREMCRLSWDCWTGKSIGLRRRGSSQGGPMWDPTPSWRECSSPRPDRRDEPGRLSLLAGSFWLRTAWKRPKVSQASASVPPAAPRHRPAFPPVWSVIIADQRGLGTHFIIGSLAVTAGERAEPVLVVERQRGRALFAGGIWFLGGHNEATAPSCHLTGLPAAAKASIPAR